MNGFNRLVSRNAPRTKEKSYVYDFDILHLQRQTPLTTSFASIPASSTNGDDFPPISELSTPKGRLTRQLPIGPVDGAFPEAVDLKEDGKVDEDVEESVPLEEDVALTRKKTLRHVTNVEDASNKNRENREQEEIDSGDFDGDFEAVLLEDVDEGKEDEDTRSGNEPDCPECSLRRTGKKT